MGSGSNSKIAEVQKGSERRLTTPREDLSLQSGARRPGAITAGYWRIHHARSTHSGGPAIPDAAGLAG